MSRIRYRTWSFACWSCEVMCLDESAPACKESLQFLEFVCCEIGQGRTHRSRRTPHCRKPGLHDRNRVALPPASDGNVRQHKIAQHLRNRRPVAAAHSRIELHCE